MESLDAFPARNWARWHWAAYALLVTRLRRRLRPTHEIHGDCARDAVQVSGKPCGDLKEPGGNGPLEDHSILVSVHVVARLELSRFRSLLDLTPSTRPVALVVHVADGRGFYRSSTVKSTANRCSVVSPTYELEIELYRHGDCTGASGKYTPKQLYTHFGKLRCPIES